MSVLMIFASCSMDTSYDNSNEIEEKTNTEKEDDSENNKDESLNEEPKEDNSENDNDGEGNSENAETVEESKEDNSKNNTEEPSNKENDTENDGVEEGNSENTEIVEESKEDDSENKDVENKTWCEISEDTKILELNYFVCIDNSQKKLSPSINDENEAKKVSFFIRDYVSKYIEIRVRYNNKKLNFSSVNNSYIITNVMKKDSTINITIEWK